MVSAITGALAIAMDKVVIGAAVNGLEGNISAVSDFVSTANAGKVGEGSEVLTLYAQSLEEVLSMLNALTGLLTRDTSSYHRAITRFVEQDH